MNRGGIFNGPTALGIPEQGVFRNAALGEVAAANIPYWCWDTPGFKDAHGKCWENANAAVAAFKSGDMYGVCEGAANDAECHTLALNSCVKSAIDLRCPWSKPPPGAKTTTPPPTPPGTKTTTPPTPPTPPVAPPSGNWLDTITSGEGFLGLPTIAWIGVAGIAAILLVASIRKKKAAQMGGAMRLPVRRNRAGGGHSYRAHHNRRRRRHRRVRRNCGCF